MRLFLRVLAFVCQLCPLCIIRRLIPKSRFALIMNNLEKVCPFCWAHAELARRKKALGAESRKGSVV